MDAENARFELKAWRQNFGRQPTTQKAETVRGRLTKGQAAAGNISHVVRRQLHKTMWADDGEQLGLFQDDAGDDDGGKANEVGRGWLLNSSKCRSLC